MDNREVLDAIHKLENKVTRMEEKVDETMRVQHEYVIERVTKLERNQMWLVTSIVAFILKFVLESTFLN